MKILEIIGSIASVISLVVAIYFQWQGKPDTQRNLVIGIGFIFLIVTVLAIAQKRRATHSNNANLTNPQIINSNNSSNDLPLSGDIFEAGNPYPNGFNSARLGSRVSILQSLYPPPQGEMSGDASSATYSLDIPEGPFRRAVYYHSGVGSDPEIRQITFWFRNPAAAQYVRREAISNLGTENVESRTLGKIIEWPEIEGARVQIDMSTYTLINPDRFS